MTFEGENRIVARHAFAIVTDLQKSAAAGLYVNLFIPSELDWTEKGFKLRQETKYPASPVTTLTGVVLLWLSAILTLYTGWDYFRAGVRHLIDD